jgi:hypothetical protein
MTLALAIIFVVWLGLNVAFVAIRLYVAAHHAPLAERDFVRHPTLVN